jgi:hypothetical protein
VELVRDAVPRLVPRRAQRPRQVDRAALDAPDVLRQAEHAVAFRAAHVGARHELGDDFRVGGRHVDRLESAGDEGFEAGRRNA